MDKKVGFIGVILFFILALGGFYFYLKQQQAPLTSAYKAIPKNVSLIIDVQKPDLFINHLNGDNPFWNRLSSLPELSQIQHDIIYFDSVLIAHKINPDFFKTHEMVISVHELGNNKYKAIFYTTIDGRIEGNSIIRKIEELLTGAGEIKSSRYNQEKVYRFTSSVNPEFQFSYGFHKGIFIISSSDILFEEAIRQIDTDLGLLQIKEFSNINATANQNADANLYVQYPEFKKWFERIIDQKIFTDNGINQFADWGEFDVNIKNNTILLNGYSASANSKGQLMKVFAGQIAQPIRFVKYITNFPEAFTILGISDTRLFRTNLAKYMEDLGQKDRFNINQQSIIDAFGTQAVSGFESLVQSELAQVTLSDGSVLFAMQTTGYHDAKDFIKQCLHYYSQNTGTPVSNFTKNFKVDNETSFEIYQMPLNKIPTRLFGPWFSQCTADYVAIFDDYLIFSNTYESLTDFIYNNVLQRTIAYNGDYKQFENFLSNCSNFYQFIGFNGSGAFFDRWVTDKTNSFIQTNKETLQEFYGIGLQFSVDNQYLYNNLLFRYQPVNSLVASTEWESRLDTVILSKPTLVLNHNSQSKEVFVQDANNTIYLLNKEGRIVWKRKIDQPILSQIYQVDYYKNGKLQLLFSTADKLYLLDRNGNFVERYPIVFTEKATAPMALFDYDDQKNYRIFVPMENKIQLYSIEGNKIEGFSFNGTDHEITKQVQYFRDNNKDYLVITDNHRVYILNRKGEDRVLLQKQIEPSINNSFQYLKSGTEKGDCLVTTTKTGEICFIYFNGEVETFKLAEFTEQHFFDVVDIDGNGTDEYIFVDKNKILAFNDQLKEIFTYEFNHPITLQPSYYTFSGKKIGIGITESESGKIYLINNMGIVWDGFPLKGSTRFSIGVLNNGGSDFNLIVGGENNYLYNYKLN